MKEVRLTQRQFSHNLGLAMEGVAVDLTAALKRDCPVDTGLSRAAIHYEVKKAGRRIEIVMPGVLLYVEFGTPPHIIRAKNAKALHFKVDGEDVFAKTVHHPGTRPNPFIRNIFHLQLSNIVRDNLKRYMAGAAS